MKCIGTTPKGFLLYWSDNGASQSQTNKFHASIVIVMFPSSYLYRYGTNKRNSHSSGKY